MLRQKHRFNTDSLDPKFCIDLDLYFRSTQYFDHLFPILACIHHNGAKFPK